MRWLAAILILAALLAGPVSAAMFFRPGGGGNISNAVGLQATSGGDCLQAIASGDCLRAVP